MERSSLCKKPTQVGRKSLRFQYFSFPWVWAHHGSERVCSDERDKERERERERKRERERVRESERERVRERSFPLSGTI
jgi:hypothetical protein